MQARLLTILLCLLFFSSFAQEPQRLLYFQQQIDQSKDDEARIIALGKLADYYSVFKLEQAADSILQKALFIAEISSDKELVLKVLFNKDIANLNAWSSKNSFERSSSFIQKGLQYAQELHRQDYIALAYIRMAGIFRKRQLFDQAIQQSTQAFTALADSKADSLRCILYTELGDIYMTKADAVPAFKNYNNAIDIAYKQKNIQLQTMIYHRFAELYRTLGDVEMGKSYLMKSLQLNTENNYTEGLYNDYIDLARITNERNYIDQAAILAEKLNSDRYKLSAKKLLYYWYMVENKNSDQTFAYLFSNPGLVQLFQNSGVAYFHWEVGNIYRYAAHYDSALYHYKLAESTLTTTYEPATRLNLYNAMAETYLKNDDNEDARNYFEKTFQLCRQLNQLSSYPFICS